MPLSREDRDLIGAGFYLVLVGLEDLSRRVHHLERQETQVMATLQEAAEADVELGTALQQIQTDADQIVATVEAGNALIAQLQEQLANVTLTPEQQAAVDQIFTDLGVQTSALTDIHAKLSAAIPTPAP